MNKHQKKTEATKQKLLKAALKVFARDGFEAARIDDIARKAGYTRGAFYAHFASKEELFLALLEDRSACRVSDLRKLLTGAEDDRDRVTKLGEFYVSRVSDEDWCILSLEFRLYALRHVKERKKLAEEHRRVRSRMKFESLHDLLPARFLRETRRNVVEPVPLALEALLCGLVLQEAYDPESISRAEMKSMLRQCFDALVRDEEG